MKQLQSEVCVKEDGFVALYTEGDTIYVRIESPTKKRIKQLFTIEGWDSIESVEENSSTKYKIDVPDEL